MKRRTPGRDMPLRRARRDSALALAIRRDDWELVALLLLHGIASAAREVPPDTIDDVLALLDAEESRDGRPEA